MLHRRGDFLFLNPPLEKEVANLRARGFLKSLLPPLAGYSLFQREIGGN